MIVDSAAVLAIILNEPERGSFMSALAAADSKRMSVANWLEAALVVDGRGDPEAIASLKALLPSLGIELVPVSLGHAQEARSAHQRFGRGNHPARLNYGDCFAYALAKVTGEPLLFKGNDFSQTDIPPPLAA